MQSTLKLKKYEITAAACKDVLFLINNLQDKSNSVSKKKNGYIKKTGAKSTWSASEIDYLNSSWGQVSIPSIAKRLKRSINAVKVKAYKSGLTRFIHFGEYITLNQLMQILTKTKYHAAYSGEKYKDFPILEQKVHRKKFKVVYMEQFWTWFENNKHKIDLSRTEDYELGLEPFWVAEKRKADKAFAKYKKTPWTLEEDKRLLALLTEYKYGFRELSIMLKRTEGAIQRRMVDLKTPMRPLRADNHTPWTKSEIAIVKDKYKKGYRPIIIAEYVNRSAKAICGLLERHNYFGAGTSF